MKYQRSSQKYISFVHVHFNGLGQDCSNSIANTLLR